MDTLATRKVHGRRIILAGVAGALCIDIFLSIVTLFSGSTPLRLSQWDASNVLGSGAFTGGLPAALLGFGLHLAVSITWAGICALLMMNVRFARAQPVTFGFLFGIVVMAVMVWLVVPLGKAAPPHFTARMLVVNLFAHTLFFGIPVASVLARNGR